MKALHGKSDPSALGEVRAFSLIELLVVIVLIAIMAALLLPTLAKAKRQMMAAACLNNQKQLASALHMYTQDNSDRIVQMADYDTGAEIYPAGGFWGGPVPDVSAWTDGNVALSAVQTGLETSNAFYFYCNNPGSYHCPADPRTQALPEPNSPNGWGYDSYSRTQNMGGAPYDNYWGAGATYIKMSDIAQPSATLSMMESADWRGYDMGTWVVQWAGLGFQWMNPPAIWHLNVSSCGFADGHGELRRWADQALVAEGQEAGHGQDSSRGSGPAATGPSNGSDYQFVYSHYLFPGHP